LTITSINSENKKNILFSNDQKIRELEQEKIFYKAFSDYMVKKDNSYHVIFDKISHILRTPLTIIKANSEMLLDDQFGLLSDIQKEKIDMIKKNTDEMFDIIFDLLKDKEPYSFRIF